MSQKGYHPSNTKDINRTYVISACKNVGSLVTHKLETKFKLQKRETIVKEPPSVEKGSDKDVIQQSEPERRLTLQRRLRTGSIEKDDTDKNPDECGKVKTLFGKQEVKSGLPQSNTVPIASNHPDGCGRVKTLFTKQEVKSGLPQSNTVSNASNLPYEYGKVRTLFGKQEVKSGLPQSNTVGNTPNNQSELKTKGLNSANGKPFQPKSLVNGLKAQNTYVSRSCEDVKGLSSRNVKGNDASNGSGSTGQDIIRTPVAKNGGLDKPKTPKSGATGLFRSTSTRDVRSPAITPKRPVSTLPITPRKTPGTTRRQEKPELTTTPSESLQVRDEAVSLQLNYVDEPHKEENCALAVAVRVRPFSKREKIENATQVVFMSGKETVVQPPDSKERHNFLFDFSFWSFNKSDPNYAGQEKVYEKLAVPLLESSLLGYNACLFAYGQTGSGKSYTMMGFDEEVGIIPRFCNQLFSRIQATKQQISFHLEMSYFEVYNEKIHDLLVFKSDNEQKKQALRVREHPLLGPYVEDLSTNVVSSFQDIQSWLELGNKQRATAATGMNDKSSRSHSVFTLILTQTKTEVVDGDEHDHRITSRISLVDLAGSERCASAKTSGDRLKEGISINKSLLTLGKVISALSESSQTKKKVFIPYRESVLTWLLKESLGGNSKTAMIATISPAVSNIEETMSTLRYAKQACLIINIAKVNEDMNAKLIRDLKSEIEKIKAAQLSAKNLDSEKYRRCQQEITSLKMKLSQQEMEMSELHRIWKERLEYAEQRKKEETKELQKAGITFKMDNRLPNLVNLNEDPQLSEMLLYMIKEGKTTVGKYCKDSSHDIQLSGALIAEDHCVITNINNIVRIIPTGEAKTYVNGNEISSSTILHHGDRVILGGDHYFRFNHPVEVQQLKGPSRVSTLCPDGPKDFEFAKNERLTAQRVTLEEEIEEARLRAKEEMMQGIQIAKEMAQQELSCQKSAYEEQIRALEAELKEETRRKHQQEMTTQKATSKILELEDVKLHLQQEILLNKRRLEMETLATKQALEDHTVRHAKILQALEDEKQKIAREVQMLQKEKGNRERSMAVTPTWNSLKLSVMIQEANTISAKLRKHTVFSRHEVTDKENIPSNPVQIQVRNLKLGIVTFWDLEKFEYKLAAMKENPDSSKEDDLFYDPADEWEPDLSKSSLSNLSRRSKSLMKNKRISGCLYEIRVHPIQSLQSGHSSGLMTKSSSFLSKSSSVCSNGNDSNLPGICKDLIGCALDYLGQSHADESSIADSLVSCIETVCKGVHAVSQAYEQQDEDGTEGMFVVNREAQIQSIQLTSAFQQSVVLTKHWLDSFSESQETSKPADSLLLNIRKLGGYLQLLLQGCCSDISAMVTEAKAKASHIVEQILQDIGHLAALTDVQLHLSKDECTDNPILQKSFIDMLDLGFCVGLKNLIESGIKTADLMQTEIQRCSVHDKVLEEMKNTSFKLAGFFSNSLADCKKLNMDLVLNDSDFNVRTSLSSALRNLKSCMDLLRHTVTSLLKGTDADISHILTSLNDIHSSASILNKTCLPWSQHIIGMVEFRSLSEALLCAIRKRDCKSANYIQPLDAHNTSVFSPNPLSTLTPLPSSLLTTTSFTLLNKCLQERVDAN
ncbi:PREDICTED: kinesin-like protein KIF14 [Nanorana parkeri]|uniref:kinesin-like protein KIF14 n=1 Tax=Nanorana parkeri TaxID=125878 RepID=UPI00085417AE|nr:PREDICTED: kinesin-like protein KIF14 [Nanorana parkeri]